MSDIAIRVQNLSKCYHIYDTPRDRLKQFVVPKLCRAIPALRKLFPTPHSPLSVAVAALAAGTARPTPCGYPTYHREFWALKDVSFEIKKGETVGIIGRNGSGKSTLLQLICGTLSPTSGTVETNGRIAALLELGSGFNPEFTGRENVRMSCALLGLSAEETEAKFDAIAAFADIGDFIEQPVKTYSSGMFVRLAFAVNIVSEPDIMIVDEALAVGDMNFQAKCMTALTRTQERGATVLFVSHDVGSVKSLCSRGVYLEHGVVKAIGKASEVAELYVRNMREEMNTEHRKFVAPEFVPERTEIKEKVAQLQGAIVPVLKRSEEFDKRVALFRYGSGGARISYVELLNMNDEPIQSVDFNQEVKIRIYVEISSKQAISVNFNISDDKKVNLTGCGFSQAGHEFIHADVGECYLAEYVLKLPLQEGSYALQALITSPVVRNETAVFLDVIENTVVFQMAKWKTARVWSKVHLFPSLSLVKVANHG